MVRLCDRWLRRLTTARVDYVVQYRADQDLDELQQFWGDELGIRPERVTMQRKSNSNRLSGRTWRSRYAVLHIRVNDTLLRAKVEGWMDRLRESWL